MSNFFCIYSGEQLPEFERSKEHIIPYSLGGPDEFVTNDVATKPNNDIGSFADGSIVNAWFIALERFRLGLKSENGNIPTLQYNGSIDKDGRPLAMRYIVNPDGTQALKMQQPDVSADWETGQVSLHCDAEDAEKKLGEIDRRAKQKGFVGKDEVEPTITRLERPQIHVEFDTPLNQMVAGFLKIALATGHFVLGYDWSTSKTADDIRACMQVGTFQSMFDRGLKGAFWPNWKTPNGESPFRRQMHIDDDKHVIWIQNEAPMGVYCLLFGQYDAVVHLHEGVWDDGGLEPGQGVVFVVDCLTRSLSRYSTNEFRTKKEKGEIPCHSQPLHRGTEASKVIYGEIRRALQAALTTIPQPR